MRVVRIIVIGTETRVRESDNSTAIGRYAKVFDSDKSTAIGYGAAVKNGDGTFYIGNITQSTDYNSFWPTRGIDSGVFGNNSSILGYATAPDGPVLPTGVRIIGNNSQVRAASDVMILGNNIMVDNLDPASNPNAPDYSGAVILGSNSSVNKYVKPTDSTINGDSFTSANYAGQGTTSTPLKAGNIVSVGAAGKERQIKNVAAGEVTATSTDAIIEYIKRYLPPDGAVYVLQVTEKQYQGMKLLTGKKQIIEEKLTIDKTIIF